MKLKSDAKGFIETIDMLVDGRIKTNLPIRKQRLIPKFVYHFTDMENAKNILKLGHVYSRKKAIELGIMTVDNACGDVIDYTKDVWKTYARFYFRPKTPTQYVNEGIRSKENINLNAHCPVPIFFLFDSKEMLTRDDSLFSFGNLAVKNEAFYKSSDFKRMPFEYIYHEGSYDNFNQGFIKVNRHAELIIPDECSLRSLKAIVCRSAGEKETFLNLLDNKTRNKYKGKVFIDNRNDFYNGLWTYVEKANLTKETVILSINKGTYNRNPIFKAHLIIRELSTNINYTWADESYEPKQSHQFSLENLKDPTSYEVKFYLDEHLAYFGIYEDEDFLPF